MVYVRMTDKFMSGWGMAKNKTNVLVIECETLEQAEEIEAAAHKRAEMIRIMICLTKPKKRVGVFYSWKKYSEMTGWHCQKKVGIP